MSYEITPSQSLSPQTAPRILSFLSSFYQTSDTESQHNAYVDYFTPDATLHMGPKTAVGTEEIRELRLGLWTHVVSRKHTPVKVFFGGEDEVMLYGIVRYVLRQGDGGEVEVPWAGRVIFDGVKEEEELRMKFYQVYLASLLFFSVQGRLRD
ncbi:hypothetical protein BJY01DRAFT_163053 [Aspergillus pseudoustus]|uniref:SnoaL-like domain-containing protein n=1 Tax=Aspergillus pseudoustus TaxID=1810923 RepID=A0ABR4K723_9EURO